MLVCKKCIWILHIPSKLVKQKREKELFYLSSFSLSYFGKLTCYSALEEMQVYQHGDEKMDGYKIKAKPTNNLQTDLCTKVLNVILNYFVKP